jgi:hypothetical protein
MDILVSTPTIPHYHYHIYTTYPTILLYAYFRHLLSLLLYIVHYINHFTLKTSLSYNLLLYHL